MASQPPQQYAISIVPREGRKIIVLGSQGALNATIAALNGNSDVWAEMLGPVHSLPMAVPKGADLVDDNEVIDVMTRQFAALMNDKELVRIQGLRTEGDFVVGEAVWRFCAYRVGEETAR